MDLYLSHYVIMRAMGDIFILISKRISSFKCPRLKH